MVLSSCAGNGAGMAVRFKFGIDVPKTISQIFAPNMRLKFAGGLRVCCMAVTLSLGTVRAADTKSAILGATREQVLARYGEPKSTIVAGSRELWFYPREKLTLRDGVVIESEPIAAEPARRPAPPPPPAPAPTADTTASSIATTPAQPAAGATAVPGQPTAPAPAPATSGAAVPPSAAPTPTLEPEPQLSIKRVTPPGANYTPVVPKPQPAVPAPETTATTMPAPTIAPAQPSTTTPAATTPATPPPAAPKPAPGTTATMPASTTQPSKVETPTETEKAETKAEETTAAAPAKPSSDKQTLLKKLLARRKAREAAIEAESEPSAFGGASYATAAAVFVVGIGFLIWRHRQRQLELAASSVSRVPFGMTAPAAGGGGARFTAELLGKLEWKRFEDLVASYYSKTGVVASRTKTGPASPVHIKISWKGEPRPFACVQCLAHRTGLIDATPLQELVTVLSAEDIRRGYVVTTGKFSVPARDYAEEKHLTLLPGDIFLEKLNALPDAARAELMQEITAGDYTTPSCPKCEAKMVRSPADPSLWQCPAHPDVTLPA